MVESWTKEESTLFQERLHSHAGFELGAHPWVDPTGTVAEVTAKYERFVVLARRRMVASLEMHNHFFACDQKLPPLLRSPPDPQQVYRVSQKIRFCPIKKFHLSKKEPRIWVRHNETNNFRELFYWTKAQHKHL